MPEKLVTVRRTLLQLDHQELRENISYTNRELPDLSVKWRRLGEVGLTLIERGEYDRAVHKQQGRLRHQNPEDVARKLNIGIVASSTAGGRLTASTVEAAFMGTGRFWHVAYLLNAPDAEQERAQLTELVDRKNGVTGFWDEFKAHVSVATIDSAVADNDVLDVFEEFMPENLTFLPARALAL